MINKILIKNAIVFDGYRFIGKNNVLIEGDKISQINNNEQISVNDFKVINAEGLILSPGFIDVHTHADLAIKYADPLNMFTQGITTVIGGNCGISAGVYNGEKLEGIINHDKWKYKSWSSTEEYWHWIKNNQNNVNYYTFVGYHSLIEESLHNKTSTISILEKALDNGYLGLSIGFDYGWGKSLNDLKQIKNLLALLADRKATVSVHLKDQGKYLTNSIAMFTELFDNSETRSITVQISHLKHKLYLDPNNTETLEKTLTLIENARANSFNIACDAYPYSGGATVLDKSMVKQCKNGWKDIYPFGYEGNIAENSDKQKISPEQYVDYLLQKNSLQLAVYRNTMSEDEVNSILDKDYCYVGSDGLPSHPRYSGTFPKLIKKYSKDEKKLKSILGRMTAGAAKHFKLNQSHTIKVGEKANLVLFDKNEITDCSTYESPLIFSKGIKAVWVRGDLKIKNQ